MLGISENVGGGALLQQLAVCQVHQPYNLFTYPRELKEVKNYSSCVGETTKTNVVIGEANSSSVSVKLSEMTGETDTSSTTNKNSFNAELGVGIGQSNAAGKTPVSVSAGFSYDETNSESSSSSSNLTNTAAYTLSWPGDRRDTTASTRRTRWTRRPLGPRLRCSWKTQATS